MKSNLDTDTALELLSAYGRPILNQFAISATPGVMAAGRWGCEVSISQKPESQMTPEEVQEMFRLREHCGARCIGGGATPREAILNCLARCQEVMESPRARFLAPVSVEMIKAQEKIKRRDNTEALPRPRPRA